MKLLSFIILTSSLYAAADDEFVPYRLRSYNFPSHFLGLNTDGVPHIVTTEDSFRIVSPGLQGTLGTISFESVHFPGRYLRHRSFLLHLDSFSEGNFELFKKDATFWPRKGKYFPGYTAYESYNFPNRFIRHQGYRLKLHSDDASNLFQMDASFKPLPECQAPLIPSQIRSINFPKYSFGLNSDNLPAIEDDTVQRFRIISPGLTGTPGTVSLESEMFPGHYLRHRSFLLHLDDFEENGLYFRDATFWIRPNKFYPGYDAIESENFPGRYIRHQGYRLKLHTQDTSELFRKDSSFEILPGSAIVRTGPFRIFSKNFESYTMGLTAKGIPNIVNSENFRFYIVYPGLTGEPGTVSLASADFPGHYLRHKNWLIHLDAFEEKSVYFPDATFHLQQDRFFLGYFALESTNYPNHYIRHQNYRLKISAYDNSQLFHGDASFKAT